MDDARKTKAQLLDELRALREENARLRARASRVGVDSARRVLGVFNATSDFVGTANPDGSGVLLNRAGLDMLGYSESSQLHVRDLHPPGIATRVITEWIPIAVRDGVWSGETNLLRRDGSEVTVSQVIMAHCDAAGNVLYISSIARDITENKRMEEALRSNERTLQALLDAITDPVMLLDASTRILSLNQASAAIIGTHVQQARGRRASEFSSGEEIAEREADMRNALQLRKAVRYEHERAGRVFDVTLQPLLTESGAVDRIAVYGRDITDWKRARKALEQRAASEALVSEVSRSLFLLPGPEVDCAIRNALETTARVLSADYAELRQVTGANARLQTSHAWFRDGVDAAVSRSEDLDTGAGSWVMECMQEVDYLFCEDVSALNDSAAALRSELTRRGVRSFVALPVRASGVVKGAVVLVWIQRAANLTEAQLAPLMVLGDVLLEAQRRKQSEEALRESEERYRMIVENQTEFIVRALPDGARTFVNESYLTYFNLTRDEAIGTAFSNWCSREDAEAVRAKIAALAPDNATLADERRVRLADGALRWNHWVDHGFFDARGALVEIQSVGRDITARKEAELALLESQERYRSLYDSTPVMLHSIDCDGHMLSVSDYWLKTLGYSRDEVIGRVTTDFLTEESRRFSDESFPSVMATGACIDLPFQVVKKNGEIIDVLTSAIVERDSNGVFQRLMAVSVDVTARRRAEAALRESEAHYWKLLEMSPDAIVIHCEGKVVFANQATLTLAGVDDVRQLQGHSVMDYVHPQYRDMVRERVARQQESSITTFVEERFVRLDGAVLDVEVAALPFMYDGKPAVQAVLRDVTRQKQAAEALRISEERFRKVFEDGPVGMSIVAPNFEVLQVNAAFCRMLGYSVDELLQRSIRDITHPDDYALDFAQAQNLMSGAIGSYQIEKRYVRKDGRTIWGRLTATLVFGADGAPLYGLGIIEDITEQKAAAEAIQQNERRYRALVQNSEDVITILGLDGVIRYESPSTATVLGYPPGYFIGRDAFELVHPDDIEATKQNFAAALSGRGEPSTPEYRIRRNDGKWIYLESVAANHIDEPGIGGIVLTSRDVSDRVAAQKAIQQSERRFRSLVQNAADITTILEKDGTIRYHSPAFYRILGWTQEQTLGESIFSFIHPDDRGATHEIFTKIYHDPATALSTEVRVRKEDGGYVVVEGVAYNLLHDDSIRGIVINARDITERRRAEEVRGKLEAQVLYAQKLESLGVLAGGIAHDFNNLLTGMLGNADLALMELSPLAPARANIQQIEIAARRAADLTRQMLAYSGRGKFVIQALRLSEVVEEMTHLLRVSISKKCVLRYGFEEGLPCIEGDATQLRQVVMNLIINASEAIGERSGVIAVRTGAMECDRAFLSESYLDEGLPEGLYVYLEVADTGCGMSEDVRAKLFDPFFTTKFTGRGLGLAAVLGIVRSHHGAIKIYSELGRGTTFKVLFPASNRQGDAQAVSSPENPAWKGSGTILVVDDDETVRALAKTMLEKHGFSVRTAEDGREGVEQYRIHHGSLRAVLLDMTMPHMDGEEAFREIRRIQSAVPVILTSGYSEQDATARFAGKGLAGFVQKPFRSDDLLTAIRKALG